MEDEMRRRTILGGLAAGAAGLAGCSRLDVLGSSGSTGEPTSTATGTASPTSTASPTPTGAAAWGRNVPTYPHPATDVSPLEAEPDPDVLNPVLTASHVTDDDARFVADPFLFVEDGTWHMFLEVLSDRGRIAHATSDDRGKSWTYDRIILEREFHLSFPQVFKWNGTYYMTTAEKTPKARLYRATKFPTQWTEAGVLFDATEVGMGNATDHALFRWNDRWWALAGDGDGNAYAFYADALDAANWSAHANNPVVKDRPTAARPGGRPIVRNDDVLAFFQDVKDYYGKRVRAYRITDLSPEKYADTEVRASPVLGPGSEEWNAHRMHQYDPWYLGDGKGWRAAVDGDGTGDNAWAIGIYRVR